MRSVSMSSLDESSSADLALMRKVAAGDKHAQRVLAHRLAARVQRISRRLVRNPADAEDGAQMALMEILRSAATYKDISSVERWADRITVRTVLRHARDQRRKPWNLGGMIDVETLGAPAEDTNAGEAAPRSAEQYLAELPEARRQVLVMKHSLGYTTEEIAELTMHPAGTVKDRLVAARKQLRKLIARDTRFATRGREKTS